jgi:hypothetical protein
VALPTAKKSRRAGCWRGGISIDDLLRASAPVVEFLLRLVFGIAVLGLKLTLELFLVSIDLRELIVSELAPTALSPCRKTASSLL